MRIFNFTIKDWKISRKPISFSDFLLSASSDKKKKIFTKAAKMSNQDQMEVFLKSGYKTH